MSLLKRQDPLIFLILAAVVVAILAPARGSFAEALSAATSVAIAVLFFLYGARLSAQEALRGLNNWRLHLLILGCTFVVFPLIGLGLRPLTLFLPQDLYLGILYLTLVPSTVQSSVAFTSIARGNVAGAIVAASVSNLAGVFLTPLLVFALMNSQSGLRIDASVFLDIALQLLIPFLLGQVARRWLGGLAAHRATKIVDRGSITMVVYSAFSAGVVEGVWATTSGAEVVFLILLSVALVALMLWLTKASARRLGFGRGDALAAQFCGTKKSLASGLPMASVMFGGGGLGLLILPLMIFHQVQLMMCSWLAARYARQDPSA
ncbi:bile acid:sodium symporter family protein [Corynebacterium mastitidis]|uniref:bile acid:sodium symporter family protein n=1 Tax=Corynebacterium mastitidis TaxID=161890 RepID=UPI00254E1985|nr:bile acid:sodium symporter family protein [Corynebacterium mastitidis]MDK8450594.1 bile acid:sodium symporter family protein [Corynebacterium mastitidis]